MERRYPQCPIPAVGAVVVKGDDVLLIVRGKEPGYGQWSIPGGAILLGETLEEAVVREIEEEVGIVTKPVGLIGAVDRIVHDEARRVLYHYVLLDFLCLHRSGNLRARSDAVKARWVNQSRLGRYNLSKETEGVVRKGLNMLESQRKNEEAK
ncbi:MAG: NUDIX domain-containing protein [Proteobacteria bacterium]|nr:NUDIX domain-containing protein [Pseudomonadota bacterium]NIS70178.1 NUDIX domain-containing protein [Pseudomonadota bacterium]